MAGSVCSIIAQISNFVARLSRRPGHVARVQRRAAGPRLVLIAVAQAATSLRYPARRGSSSEHHGTGEPECSEQLLEQHGIGDV